MALCLILRVNFLNIDMWICNFDQFTAHDMSPDMIWAQTLSKFDTSLSGFFY